MDPHLIHGSLDLHESAPKRHLNLFSRFCTAYLCAKHTDSQGHRQTGTQTTLRATSIVVGRITYCFKAMRPNNKCPKIFDQYLAISETVKDGDIVTIER